jgi:hypothetical protein
MQSLKIQSLFSNSIKSKPLTAQEHYKCYAGRLPEPDVSLPLLWGGGPTSHLQCSGTGQQFFKETVARD